MATATYSFFGATWQEVKGHLGGASLVVSDFANVRRTVQASSTTLKVYLDSVDNLTVGDKVNINTGAFPADGETRTVATIGSNYVTVSVAFSQAPVAGDVLNDGP